MKFVTVNLLCVMVLVCDQVSASTINTFTLNIKVDNKYTIYVDGTKAGSGGYQGKSWDTYDLLGSTQVVAIKAVNDRKSAGVRVWTIPDVISTNLQKTDWKCIDADTSLGAEWIETAFNDSSWPVAVFSGKINPTPPGSIDTIYIWTSIVRNNAAIYCRGYVVSDCSPNPCLNGGSCALTSTGFQCSCPTGFEGPTCTPERTFTLNIKVDNTYTIYVDGNWTGSGGYQGDSWDSYDLLTSVQVVAINATNDEREAGIRVWSFPDVINTDLQKTVWKCIDADPSLGVEDWTAIAFNDSSWPFAVFSGKIIPILPGSNDTIYIWTPLVQNYASIYCRGYVGPANSTCDSVDLVFVVDDSGSVGRADFEKTKDFMVDVVSQLVVSEENVHVGAVRFNSYARVEITLEEGSNSSSIETQLMDINYAGGGTNIDEGIRVAREMVFNQTGDRPDHPDVIVLITDGQGGGPTQAQLAKDEDITIICVAVGNSVNTAVLEAMSSPGKLLQIDSYDEIWTLVDLEC